MELYILRVCSRHLQHCWPSEGHRDTQHNLIIDIIKQFIYYFVNVMIPETHWFELEL